MRKIKIKSWKGKDTQGIEYDETLLTALSVLIANKKPEEIPRGLDKFRLFHRLSKAFSSAEKSGTLALEEIDYEFLKAMIEKDVPSVWGMNPNITGAIEEFLGAKEESVKD